MRPFRADDERYKYIGALPLSLILMFSVIILIVFSHYSWKKGHDISGWQFHPCKAVIADTDLGSSALAACCVLREPHNAMYNGSRFSSHLRFSANGKCLRSVTKEQGTSFFVGIVSTTIDDTNAHLLVLS
jgi:hypothetical protein